jgi:transcriptional regulator with XRE-family HTH domain
MKSRLPPLSSPESSERSDAELIWAFAVHLAKRRHAAGLSQAKLAYLAKVPIGTLAGLETGSRFPRVETLIRLLKPLNVSVSTFFREIGL